jgi:hypothetical protein
MADSVRKPLRLGQFSTRMRPRQLGKDTGLCLRDRNTSARLSQRRLPCYRCGRHPPRNRTGAPGAVDTRTGLRPLCPGHARPESCARDRIRRSDLRTTPCLTCSAKKISLKRQQRFATSCELAGCLSAASETMIGSLKSGLSCRGRPASPIIVDIASRVPIRLHGSVREGLSCRRQQMLAAGVIRQANTRAAIWAPEVSTTIAFHSQQLPFPWVQNSGGSTLHFGAPKNLE